MEKFYCENCKKIFEAEGTKKEWESPIFGKCWKLVGICPECGKECDEWRSSWSKKSMGNCSGTCPTCPGCV
jgi:hypothetical protein